MRLKLEWECAWEQRKIDLATNILRRELSFLGGVSNIGRIEPAVATSQEEPKARLSLICSWNPRGKGRCGMTWDSETFTPCPKCGQRRWVKKVDKAA